jgi:hypothetical protein
MALPQGISFDADAFRDGIHIAMELGLSPDEDRQPTFYFREQTDAGGAAVDDDGLPFDPTVVITTTIKPPVKVACAVEYQDAAGKVLDFGVVQASRVLLTFLDVDYAQVLDTDGGSFAFVVIDGDRFWYSKTVTAMGMGSVGVHQVYARAEDDT